MRIKEEIPIEFTFIKGQVVPRLTLIVSSWQLWMAIGLATVTTTCIPFVPFADLKISEVASIGLSFASISLIGCLTTCALAIFLPGDDRIKRWSSSPGEIEKSSDYSDLIFVLVWATLAQFTLVITCIIALLCSGNNVVFPATAPMWQFVSIFCAAITFYYAALEVLTVIETMMKIAILIMFEEKSEVSQ